MPALQACTLTFHARNGAGSQTVTGVVDRDGDPFVGKLFLFQSAYYTLNAVVSGAPGIGGYTDIRGIDTGVLRASNAAQDCYTPFNFKGVSSGLSRGDYSLLDFFNGTLGIGVIDRTAKISAIRSGEFDLDYVTNFSGAQDDILVMVIGGDDIDFTFTAGSNGAYSTVAKPQGLLSSSISVPSASGSTIAGVGGQNMPWGFATRDGVYGASGINVVNQGQNYSALRTDAWGVTIEDTTGALGSLPTISSWGDTSFTIANNGGPSVVASQIVVCGENIRTAGGVFTQPDVTGEQVIEIGIDPYVLMFFSIGEVENLGVTASSSQQVMGWTTAVAAQAGVWTGEATVGNTGGPIKGARYLSDDSVLRFGAPNGGPTTYGSVAAVTEIDSEGAVTLDWASVDGTLRQILWFAIGVATAPPPPPPEPIFHTREVVRRRLRRAPIVWSEKDGLQTRVRVNLFAVDMQPGAGRRDTPDPLVMIRASKDGGFTWGNERLVSAGRVGEYFDRLNSWQWGQGRDWVFEVACTDPVTWNLLGAYLDAEGGTS